nr:hypothetical protein [Tanacetum cinerariifolium]
MWDPILDPPFYFNFTSKTISSGLSDDLSTMTCSSFTQIPLASIARTKGLTYGAFPASVTYSVSSAAIFQLVGAPLVENCIFGFNSSDFAYGQAAIFQLVGAPLVENCISRFNSSDFTYSQEQQKHTEKQLAYQCRCSFLEIYNEYITDLLNPGQGNLLIREDIEIGLYIENLTKEPVASIKEVTRLLKKNEHGHHTEACKGNRLYVVVEKAKKPRDYDIFQTEMIVKDASNVAVENVVPNFWIDVTSCKVNE